MPTDATSLALSPDGNTLAVGTRAGVVALINTATGALVQRLQPPPGESQPWVSTLAFAPDNFSLAVGTQQGQLLLWSLSSPTAAPLRLPGHRGGVSALSYAPDGLRLAVAGNDKTVDVWDLSRLHAALSRLGLER